MRENIGFLLALLIVLLVGIVGYQLIFGPRGPSIVVIDADGQAVRVRPAAGSEALAAGDPLSVNDQVVVGENGRLRLGIGGSAELTLQSNSALRLTEVTDDGVRVELEGGRVSARVRAGGPALGVRAQGRELGIRDGEINAALRDDGALSVEVLAGELAVTGVPAVTSLRAGERLDQSAAGEGRTTPVVDTIAVDVVAVTATADVGLVQIEARTLPYARVELRGVGVAVGALAGPDGAVTLPPVRVPTEGADVELVVVDALGREGAVRHRLEGAAGPRLMGTAVQWGP